MKTVKRKSSTSEFAENSCCRKLSVFACACAVASLLVHTYNYVETGRYDDSLDNVLVEKIDAYLAEMGTTPLRMKREAMLVNLFTRLVCCCV